MHSAISLGGVAFGFLSLWRFIGFGAALPARLACGTDQRLARTLNRMWGPAATPFGHHAGPVLPAQTPNAEADGSRTRRPTLDGPLVLKIRDVGVGWSVEC